MSRASFRFVWYIKIYFFKSLEFPTELNDFEKLFLQNFESCLSRINYNFFNTRVFIAKSSRWRKLEGAKGGRRVRNNKIPGRRISVARSRLRERRAIKRGFPSTSADGSGTCSLRKHDVVHPTPLFHAQPRTIRASYVYRRFYSINWNCTSPRKLQSFRQLSKGWRERNCLRSLFFSFSHLSIHFCKVFDKMAEIFYSKWYNTRRGKNGGSFVIICDKLTRVPYLSFL